MAGCLGNAAPDSRSLAHILRMRQNSNSPVASRKFMRNQKALVRRTIIDDYDFEGKAVIRDIHDARDATLQRRHFVVAGNNYAQLGSPLHCTLHNYRLRCGLVYAKDGEEN